MLAAIGCARLEKFPTFIERRIENFNRFKAELDDKYFFQLLMRILDQTDFVS